MTRSRGPAPLTPREEMAEGKRIIDERKSLPRFEVVHLLGGERAFHGVMSHPTMEGEARIVLGQTPHLSQDAARNIWRTQWLRCPVHERAAKLNEYLAHTTAPEYTDADDPNGGFDPVNRPRHYNSHPSGIEAITITEWMNFNLGSAMKYLWRADEKGAPIEDLKKAVWYLEREIAKREKMAAKEKRK